VQNQQSIAAHGLVFMLSFTESGTNLQKLSADNRGLDTFKYPAPGFCFDINNFSAGF